MTYDGQTIRLYVNGELDNRPGVDYTYTTQKNIEDYIIVGAWALLGTDGGRKLYSGYKLNGSINDFRIYDHCLTPKEVRELAQGLTVHYRLGGNEFDKYNLVNDSKKERRKNAYLIHTYKFDYNGLQRFLNAGEAFTLTVCFTPDEKFDHFNPHFGNGWAPIGNISSDGTTNRQI